MAGRTSSKRAPEAIRLTAADSVAFAEALLHPREPVPELRAAAERYRKMVEGGCERDRGREADQDSSAVIQEPAP